MGYCGQAGDRWQAHPSKGQALLDQAELNHQFVCGELYWPFFLCAISFVVLTWKLWWVCAAPWANLCFFSLRPPSTQNSYLYCWRYVPVWTRNRSDKGKYWIYSKCFVQPWDLESSWCNYHECSMLKSVIPSQCPHYNHTNLASDCFARDERNLPFCSGLVSAMLKFSALVHRNSNGERFLYWLTQHLARDYPVFDHEVGAFCMKLQNLPRFKCETTTIIVAIAKVMHLWKAGIFCYVSCWMYPNCLVWTIWRWTL